MLQNIKPDKAAGPDSLPVQVLRELSYDPGAYIADQSKATLCPVTGKLPILLQSLRKVTDIKPAINYRPVFLDPEHY